MSSAENTPPPSQEEPTAPDLESSPPEDTFRILLATDNHLGYMEKDGERFHDSFTTFEEILQMAGSTKVDFVLLGGDLFHENRPSLRTMHRCTELLRQHSLNSKPIEFQILSDQAVNFGHSATFPVVNYEDPNLNVGLPVFSIHGNHDDPVGSGGVCALDIFHAAGLVNLFGKVDSVEKVQLSPILLRKGSTRLALYGLGACKDERLYRLFVGGQVEFLRPTPETDDPDNEWFCILVLHQNRARHGATNYIPESLLPDFLHLVIWGHEHECRITPEWIPSRGFYVSQPGSSVATSLSQGEAGDKAAGLIEIHGAQFRLSSSPLRTVRPFVMHDICLEDEAEFQPDDRESARKVEELCTTKVEEYIAEAFTKGTGHAKQPTIPLIRVRVDYSGGYESFSVQRFGQKFVGRVANPKDLLIFHRRREKAARNGTENEQSGVINVTGNQGNSLSTERIESMVRQFFETAGEDLQLRLLVERVVGAGITAFVDKDVKGAIGTSVEQQITRARDHLQEEHPDEEDVLDEVTRYRDVFSTSIDQSGEIRLGDFTFGSIVSPADGASTSTTSIASSSNTRGGTGRGRGRGRGQVQGSLEAAFSRTAPSQSKNRMPTIKTEDDGDGERALSISDVSEDDGEGSMLSMTYPRKPPSRGGRGSRGKTASRPATTRGGQRKRSAEVVAFSDDDEESPAEESFVPPRASNSRKKIKFI